jgi:hypothetical protein
MVNAYCHCALPQGQPNANPNPSTSPFSASLLAAPPLPPSPAPALPAPAPAPAPASLPGYSRLTQRCNAFSAVSRLLMSLSSQFSLLPGTALQRSRFTLADLVVIFVVTVRCLGPDLHRLLLCPMRQRSSACRCCVVLKSGLLGEK